MTVLVTGAAGFIGAYTCRAPLACRERAIGLDSFNAGAALGFEPHTTIEQALPEVVAWCQDYFGDAA